ncbi:MAG: hypothetical protein Q9214_003657 [Letrouitia sp. 1 TL-2023]
MGYDQDSSQAVYPSGEKNSLFASKDVHSTIFSAKPGWNQLIRRLLVCLVLGLLFLGLFYIKPSISIINQFNNPLSFTTKLDYPPRHPRHPPPRHPKHPHYERCPQVDPLWPRRTTHALRQMDERIESEEYAKVSAALLSEAIQYRTVSYDNMSNPDFPLDDPLYDSFENFYKRFISHRFPKFTETLTLDRFNKHGLLFTWQGSNSDLKPTLLLAHQDVVPVEEASLDDWYEEPWSGKIEDGFIWGRGSFDDKHPFIAILEAIEELLNADFEPRRTILLSSGFDEEIGGTKGAKELAKYIISIYGETAVILDEGSTQFDMFGSSMVGVGVTEKIRMPVTIEVRTPGGHSSQPFPHTAIGIMSEIVVGLEDQKYNTYISENHPILSLLTCAQEHTENFPPYLNWLLNDRLEGNIPPEDDDILAIEFVNSVPKYLQSAIMWSLTTAKSVNIIEGGIKVNSLPEFVTATTDTRIHIAETTESTKKRTYEVVRDVAKRHGLKVIEFDNTDPDTPNNSIRLYANVLGETPRTSPSDPTRNIPYKVLSGTVRSLYPDGRVIVTPVMTPGNTDTKWYTSVSKNIYRYSAGASIADSANMHTVNEKMSAERHVAGVGFYTNFIRNMDEADV